MLCDHEGVPNHVQKITIYQDKVLFTLCTGHRYWRSIRSLDPNWEDTRLAANHPMDYIAHLSNLLEDYINSELGLFYGTDKIMP